MLGAPRRIAVPPGPPAGRLPKLADLGLKQEVSDPAPGGESAARRRLGSFLDADVRQSKIRFGVQTRRLTFELFRQPEIIGIEKGEQIA